MWSSKKDMSAVLMGVLLACQATLGQTGSLATPPANLELEIAVYESSTSNRLASPPGRDQVGKPGADERVRLGEFHSSGPQESGKRPVSLRSARVRRSEVSDLSGPVRRQKSGEGYIVEYSYIGAIGSFSPPSYARLYVGENTNSIKAEMRATTQLDYCRLETNASVYEYSFYSRYYEGDAVFFDLDAEEFVRHFGCYATTAGTDEIFVYLGATYFNVAPSAPTRPSGPSIGLVGQLLGYGSSTDDARDDLVSLVFVWDDGTQTQTDFEADETVHHVTHAYQQPGRYEIRSYAIDEYGAVSDWSIPISVQIERENAAPNAPSTPAGKDVAFMGEVVEYAVSATDPDGDPVRITMEWGDGTAPTLSPSVPSGSNVTIAHTFARTGDFGIRAFATDSKGLAGTVSNAKSVQVVPSELPTCIMDCNGDAVVTVDEIILGTSISLGSQSISGCMKADQDGNGTVTVDEIVRGIYNSLNGCPR